MPRPDYRTCRVCGRSAEEVSPLSHTRLCIEDALRLREENARSLAAKSGPEFRRWRRAMAASVGGVLLDDIAGNA